MKSLLREPLLHFLALGLLLFGLFHWRSASGEPGGGTIEVSRARLQNLAHLFSRTRLRSPTPEELGGLVEDFVREEVFYREALALGLDQDDTIVRRRMRQKLEFLAGDLAEAVAPTDLDLQGWLAARAEDYRRGERCAFRQVHLSPARRGAELDAGARALLLELETSGAAADPALLGDPIDLPHRVELAEAGAIDALFGPGFAEALAGVESGRWAGPIESAYGLHLVRVEAREPGGLPALPEVRDAVERDWTFARRSELLESYYRSLRARYRVEVDWPAGAGAPDRGLGGAEAAR